MRYKTSHCGKFWGGGSAKDCTFTILETFEHISDNINLIINHDTPQGKIKVRNCSKFGEKIKVASKCKQRRQYCQNIGPWWYSSCFNAKCSPKVPKYGILLTRVGFSLFSLFFFTKSGQTKTHFFQCFLMMWPILRGTMWKLTSRGFRKCGTFWDLEVSNQSYCCPKFGHFQSIYFGKCRCPKKIPRPQFWSVGFTIESEWGK